MERRQNRDLENATGARATLEPQFSKTFAGEATAPGYQEIDRGQFWLINALSGHPVMRLNGNARQLVSAGLAASLTRAPIEVKRSPFLRPAVRMCGSASMLRDGSEIPS